MSRNEKVHSLVFEKDRIIHYLSNNGAHLIDVPAPDNVRLSNVNVERNNSPD